MKTIEDMSGNWKDISKILKRWKMNYSTKKVNEYYWNNDIHWPLLINVYWIKNTKLIIGLNCRDIQKNSKNMSNIVEKCV